MTELSNLPDNQLIGDDEEISLLDLLIVLAKYKLLILGLPFVVAVIAAVYSLTLPDIFTANTKILPPQGQSGASAALVEIGGLAGLARGGVAGIKNPNDIYIAMLKSRTVADNLIQRFGLMKSSDPKYPSAARNALAGVTNVTSGKDGVITVEVDDVDPKHAAELANAYVEELLKFIQVLAVTQASQRRLFFEQQFEQARDNLAKAEAAARQGLEMGGLVQVEGQGRAMVEVTTRLRGEITLKEVQIGAMRTFATDRNPGLLLAQQELESMKRELARMEGASGSKPSNGRVNNGSGIDNLGLLRNIKYYEIMYELLAKQFELAKIDEGKDSAVIQVMDKAVEPDRKSKPKRSLIVLLSALAAAFVAILCAFGREAIVKARSDPQQAARLQAFDRYRAWR